MDCEFDRKGTTTLCLLCHAKVTPIVVRPILVLKHFQNRTIEILLEQCCGSTAHFWGSLSIVFRSK